MYLSRFGCLLLGFAWLTVSAHGEEPPLMMTTHTYKTVGGIQVQADVHRPNDALIRPVVVWIHGGALIMGNRSSVPKDLLDLCRTEGYALASLDYRLAPEVKLTEII